MNYTHTLLRKPLLFKALCAIFIFCTFSTTSRAQIIVSADKTATILATALVGTGVTIISPVLTCPGNANGTFYTTVVSPIGIPTGIVLTNGNAVDTLGNFGVADPSSTFASTDNGVGGDVDLTALAGQPTFDRCVLEFDFRAAGDSIRFNYVFGSEEYTSFTCSPFNDVFGFFISGGGFTTPTNLALVPGTSIPVCINSVNCGPTGGYTITACTAMGPGSPFCAYYINNLTGFSAPYVTYDGLTTVLTAQAAVSPCDTYHLKLGIADASDHVLDSGVFIEGGSLSSNPPAAITALGTSGLPYCIRGCAPGNFVFVIPKERDTPTVVKYLIVGTAVNGYDYATIADSIIIPAHDTFSILNINPLIVPAVGPKVVTLEIQIPDPCHPGVFTTGGTASLTILDSFGFHIITPDTAICQGEHVDIRAVGDTIFGGILHYIWSPSATISDDTLLSPTATPTVTTTYTLRDSTAAILGCATEFRHINIRVYDRPILTIDSALVKTCVGISVPLHVYAYPDTIPNTYAWTPTTDLSSSTIYNPIVNPSTPGDVFYTITVNPTAIPGCTSTTSIHVHTVPNDFVLNNHDTAICIGAFVQVSITGTDEFTYRWTPPTGVSDVNIKEPVITPTTTGTYTVTASYAHCPDMVHSFNIEVDYPAPTKVITDTICLGMSDSVDFTSTVAGYYHYQWTPPPTYMNNDTIPNPVITPTSPGNYSWTVSIAPHAAGCTSFGVVNLLVAPNSFTISPTDTAICRGQNVQVLATNEPLFHYQWLPTAGIAMSNIVNPLITPDTSAMYVVTATFSKCPDMHDTLRLDVQPVPAAFIGGSRFVCAGDTLHINALVAPTWYTHYSYSWTPATHLDNNNTDVVIFSGDKDTTIIMTVSTPVGCTTADSARITVFAHSANLDTTNWDFCPHDSLVLHASGAVTYQWSPALYLSDSTGSQPVIKPITSQTYSVIATSSHGCKDTLHFQALVHPGAVIFIGDDTVTLHPGETYQIQPQTNCTRFMWFPPAGLSNAYVSDPLASPQISTKYIVHGYTEYGCKASDSIDIYVDPETLLALPNAFTPGSGPNNEFKIIKRGIATLNYFRIFNRWGNLVFETTDIDKGWNGEFHGTPQPFGVFVYEIEAVTTTGKIFQKHGNTTLIR
jgi:gliding motility-associated-like protein